MSCVKTQIYGHKYHNTYTHNAAIAIYITVTRVTYINSLAHACLVSNACNLSVAVKEIKHELEPRETPGLLMKQPGNKIIRENSTCKQYEILVLNV